jgi:hypothetical protein
MKIFKQEEVDEAANNIKHNLGLLHSNPRLLSTVSFVSGVEFAESKIGEIAVEFSKWLHKEYRSINPLYEKMLVHKCTELKVFEIFLKDRAND